MKSIEVRFSSSAICLDIRCSFLAHEPLHSIVHGQFSLSRELSAARLAVADLIGAAGVENSIIDAKPRTRRNDCTDTPQMPGREIAPLVHASGFR